MRTSTRMRLLGVVAGVAAAVGLSAPAQALSDYGDVVATWNGTLRAASDGTRTGGVFTFVRDNANSADNFPGVLVTNSPIDQFIGVCIEIGETISANIPNTFTVRDLKDAPIDSVTTMGSPRDRDVAKLVTLALFGNLANALNTTLVPQARLVAFQIALWEITQDRINGPGTYNLGGGGYTASNALATEWLTTLNGGNTIPLAPGLYALTSGGQYQEPDRQDMLVQVVPIPAAAWLLASGLLGLFGISRRRKVVAA